MTSKIEPFNSDIYKRIRLPLLEADTMPTECYTSRDFYNLEIKKIFHKVWNFIGRADLVPQIGDYYACLLYTSPSPRDLSTSRMPSSA